MTKEQIRYELGKLFEDGFAIDCLTAKGYKAKEDAEDNIFSEQDFEKGLDLVVESYFNVQE